MPIQLNSIVEAALLELNIFDVNYCILVSFINADIETYYIDCRIDANILREFVLNLNISKLQTYICGPPPMIESVAANLSQIGIAKEDINYEKWW